MQLYHIILVAVFIAALLGMEALYGFWNASRGPEVKRIARRLRMMSSSEHEDENIQLIKKRQLESMPPIERMLMSLPRIPRLDQLLEQAGSNMSVTSLLSISASFFILGLIAGWYFSSLWLFGLASGIAIGSVPLFFIVRAKQKRMRKMLLQLPDALELIARAMRAGHAFSGGLKMVADEMPEPIAGEFRLTFDELNYGLSMENAMLHLSTRVDIPDMKYFVISVLIQRETGGNLASVLEKIGSLIRERLRLFGRIRVLSSQGRLEAWILSILPFAVAGILFIIWPQFISLLWTEPLGRIMLATAGVMLIVGVLIMWRMVRIRV